MHRDFRTAEPNRTISSPDSVCKFLRRAPIPVRAACRKWFLHAASVRTAFTHGQMTDASHQRAETQVVVDVLVAVEVVIRLPLPSFTKSDRARSVGNCWQLRAGCAPARACALPPIRRALFVGGDSFCSASCIECSVNAGLFPAVSVCEKISWSCYSDFTRRTKARLGSAQQEAMSNLPAYR